MRKLSYSRRYSGFSRILAIFFASACGASVSGPATAPDADQDAPSGADADEAAPVDAAPYDATLPWYGPDPAGNEPPHRIR